VTDILDEKAFADALFVLSSDKKLLSKLSSEAMARPIKNWGEYTRKLVSILRDQSTALPRTIEVENGIPVPLRGMPERKWEDILYPDCLLANWQMNHSERLALTALLARHKPNCSIEIGTFQGGSLSLISQYSNMVFSVDIDPSVANKFSYFENVSFLTGPSKVILPMLMKELDSAAIPIDFILIDGDHSAAGIARDLNIVLEYTPQKPLFVVMHDSFNPECRRGMQQVDWNKSPYVQWVDIDFVPGRIIEHGGGGHGEMWGGLGLAYLTSGRRVGSIPVLASADMMFSTIKSRQNNNDNAVT
jgi:hypothetical protein